MVSAKRLKTGNGHAPAYLKCAPSNQLPVAVSAVVVVRNVSLFLKKEHLHSTWKCAYAFKCFLL